MSPAASDALCARWELTKEEVCAARVGIVAPSVRYIADGEDIKLLQPTAACCVDWK